MSDHDALLAAIVDHPDEDTPRLMFADWLDEHAGALADPAGARARAAFIRSDIAMSLLDEYDPARLRWELIEKPRHEAEPWAAGALPPLPTGFAFDRGPLFRRGFPWALAAPDPDAPPSSSADTAAPVERLRFVRCGPAAVAAVRAAPWRARLRDLAFENRGPVEPPDALANFAPTPVERLTFVNEALSSGEARVLIASALFERLTSLTVVRGGIGTAVAEALVREGARSALRELSLVGSGIPLGTLRALLTSPVVAPLRALALGGDLIGSPMKYGMLSDLVAPNLTALDLSDDSPRAEAIEALVMSPLCAQLRRLDLSRSSLNRARTQILANGAFDNLRVLKLYGNSAGNDGVIALTQSPRLAGLRVLDLGYTQVGDDGVRAILDSPWADGLAFLSVVGSPASAETKEALKARMGDRVRL
jgi:uncharacterized protein (TIGR02996 family)